METGTGFGSAMGLGGVALGGIGGLVLGSMINGNGGLFGNNNRNGDGAVALGYGELMEEIADAKLVAVQAANSNAITALQQTGALSTAIAGSNLQTLQSVNGLGNQIVANNTQGIIQNLNSFNQLGAITQNGFNQTNMTQLESANDIKTSLAAMSAPQQACCCEILRGQLESTQKILDQNTTFRIQDLQIELSNSKQTLALRDSQDAQTSIILRHLAPYAPVVRTA